MRVLVVVVVLVVAAWLGGRVRRWSLVGVV